MLLRNVPVKKLQLAEGETLVASVFDLLLANYGIDRGLGGGNVASELRPERPVHAGLAGGDHRREGRRRDHGCAPVRRQRRQDARQVDGDHRRGDEPLVSLRHELPRHHQHAGDVRLRRCVRRRLGPLRRPGETAAADRLDRARVRARLASPAAPDEFDLVLLRAYRSMALREARDQRDPLAAGRSEGIHGLADRLQCARRAHGLAAIGAATADQPDPGGQGCAGRRNGSQGLCGEVAQGRQAAPLLRGPGQPGQFPEEPVRVAFQPARLLGQGPRVFPQAPARHQHGVQGKDLGASAARNRRKWSGARRRPRASSTCW